MAESLLMMVLNSLYACRTFARSATTSLCAYKAAVNSVSVVVNSARSSKTMTG